MNSFVASTAGTPARHQLPPPDFEDSASPTEPAPNPRRAASKPTLTQRDYMAELNARLRRHPMYLEGMRFPDPAPGSTPMLAAALAWEGPWDYLGVFSSVIEDVAGDYDLAMPAHCMFAAP